VARGVAQAYKARRAPGAGAGGAGAAAGCWRHRASPARGGPGALATRPAGTDARQTFTYWSLRPCAAAPRAPSHGRASGPHAPAARRAYAAPPRPVLRPRPAPPLGAGTGDMGNSRAMLSVCRVAGERPRHYKYQSLNEHTYVVREAMERRSAPSPARPATRPRTGRDPRPPLQRDWSAAPPAAPAAPRAAGRPYTEPGCVVRRYHGTFYSILRGLGFFAGLPSGGSWTACGELTSHVVLGSCIV
jgi:hypothetical protein